MTLKIFTKIKSNAVVLRIIDKNNQVVWYRSSRLGTIKINKDSYEAEIPEKLAGCGYELKNLLTRKIIETGKIVKEKKEFKAVKAEQK